MSSERTDYGETESSRSTYSVPYDWLFPFGLKHRESFCKRIQNEVLAERNEQPLLPKLLRARVFFGIKETDRAEALLIDMQRALGRYWISVSKQI